MKIGALLFLVSAVGTGLAFGVWDLIFWRLVGGLGIGLASVIAPPAYISEISPRHVRGRLASLQQLAITTGIFAALLSDAVLANSAGGADGTLWLGIEAWRWMFIACALPAAVYGWIAFRLPESPTLPRAQRQRRPSPHHLQQTDPPAMTSNATSARSRNPSNRKSSPPRRARCVVTGSACCQWSGSASSCLCCSSLLAST